MKINKTKNNTYEAINIFEMYRDLKAISINFIKKKTQNLL